MLFKSIFLLEIIILIITSDRSEDIIKSLRYRPDRDINSIEKNIWVSEKHSIPNKNNKVDIFLEMCLIPKNISPKNENANPIKIRIK